MSTIGGTAVRGSDVVAAMPFAAGSRDEVLAQSQRPAEAFTGTDALARALASQAPWIWLLGDRVRPRPDALEQLLDQARPGDERPASLLAGMVLDAAGAAVAPALPAGGGRELADVVRLAGRSLLPIRHAPFANCLVARECFIGEGFPQRSRYGRYAPVEWTARVLRTRDGYFVPASVVVSDGGTGRRDGLTSIPALARMARSGTWTRGETLAAARALAGQVIGGARAPARGPGAAGWRAA